MKFKLTILIIALGWVPNFVSAQTNDNLNYQFGSTDVHSSSKTPELSGKFNVKSDLSLKSTLPKIESRSIRSKVFKGTESGGGGDADVVTFLKLGHTFVNWIKDGRGRDLDISIDKVEDNLKLIEDSLNGKGPAKLIFTQDTVLDFNRVPKMAVFNSDLTRIVVQRDLWRRLQTADQYTLVSIELAGVSGSRTRYSDAVHIDEAELAHSNELSILCGKKVDPKKISLMSLMFNGQEDPLKPYYDAQVCNAGGGGHVSTICETSGNTVLIVEADNKVVQVYLYPLLPFY